MTQLDHQIGKPLATANVGDKIERFRAVFSALGLQPDKTFGYLQYSGELNGRKLSISVAARTKNQYVIGDIRYKKYMGMIMSVQMETAVKTRFLLSKAALKAGWLVRFLQNRQGNSAVDGLGSYFDAYLAWANEPDWVRGLLGKTAVQAALQPLLFEDNQPTDNTINFAANGTVTLGFATTPLDLTPEMMQAWLDSLSQFITLAEATPPQKELSLRWLEKQTGQARLFILIAGFLRGTTLLIGLLCFIPFITILLLNAR